MAFHFVAIKQSSRLALKFLNGNSRFERCFSSITHERLSVLLMTASGQTSVPFSISIPGSSILSNTGVFDSPITMDVQKIWEMFKFYEQRRNQSIVDIWRQGQKLLVLNMVLWEWLEISLEDAYASISNHLPENLTGLELLLHRVEEVLHSRRTESSSFDAADYLSGFAPKLAVGRLNLSQHHHFQLGDKLQVIDAAIDLIVPWLHFPSREVCQLKAWFTRKVIDHVGIEALLIEEIWDASGAVKTCFLPRQANAIRTSRQRIQVWADALLPLHPIAMHSSQERGLLTALDTQVQQSSPIDLSVPLLARKFSHRPAASLVQVASSSSTTDPGKH